MSRGRGEPLANLGPNSFAYAILIFWLLVQAGTPAGTVPASTYGTVGTGTDRGTYLRYGTVPVFTGPVLSGYLTRISETRVVKLR